MSWNIYHIWCSHYFVRKYILSHIMFSLFCQEIYIVRHLNVYYLLLGIFYDQSLSSCLVWPSAMTLQYISYIPPTPIVSSKAGKDIDPGLCVASTDKTPLLPPIRIIKGLVAWFTLFDLFFLHTSCNHTMHYWYIPDLQKIEPCFLSSLTMCIMCSFFLAV